jgi:hypothetical protein
VWQRFKALRTLLAGQHLLAVSQCVQWLLLAQQLQVSALHSLQVLLVWLHLASIGLRDGYFHKTSCASPGQRMHECALLAVFA